MNKLVAFITILRPHNALMTTIAVVLGIYLAQSQQSIVHTLYLCLAAFLAVGFGNVINDILDKHTDSISHPTRPIPHGTILVREARMYAILLALGSLCAGLCVSRTHGVATAVPLVLLLIYALFLKSTPLAGNILVSVLVAFPLVYGSLTGSRIDVIIIPASLAFLQNLSREIIKDIQDKEGDMAAGIKTTAALSKKTIHLLLTIITVTFLALVGMPYFRGQMGLLYLIICCSIVVPLHMIWYVSALRNDISNSAAFLSRCIKCEMTGGLLALFLDKALR